MSKKVFLLALLVFNVIVLCGQIWPEQAPPFAVTVNIIFLSLSFVFFFMSLIKRSK
ncbi:MAG: hypothetical protein ACJ77K_01025 [Bacteroidia bacterium]